MTLPRWTAYVALAILALFLVTAVPRRPEPSWNGAALAERAPAPAASPGRASKDRRLVVLGIDGLDPDILKEVIERYPERMPNFRRLAREGAGIRSLGTATPPQSPVAWSNFITGRNPGGHGIFDFIHRNRETYAPAPSTVTETDSGYFPLPGQWRFPTGGGGDTNRSGKPFWQVLQREGVAADLWRMPINFPVEGSKGLSFSGMMTPALDSAYGEFTYYASDPPLEHHVSGGKIVEVAERGGVIRTSLYGPPNAFKDDEPVALAPLDVYVDHERAAAVLKAGDATLVLEPGEWSDFVQVSFEMLPLGAMDLAGIVRFYLRSIEPEFELYASPINFDPTDPVEPVSQPESASADLAKRIGLYYTQGMAEEVSGLKAEVLSDAEFMRQAQLVYDERNRMLEDALERYVTSDEGGLLFFYYSTIDLCCHMMWRHADDAHPFHDESIASQPSAWWSGREGSTWHDVVDDLYLRMDPVLGRIRERVGDDVPIMVMSDHGFAPFHRKFHLNTWLLEEGYLVLSDGQERELPADDPAHSDVYVFAAADWSKTRAYNIGFNAIYLNLAGRESGGIVKPGAEAEALVQEIRRKLEALDDGGVRVVTHADLAKDVYQGERTAEAPEIIVGFNVGYGNSDESTQGRIPHEVVEDNAGGSFNGSHLMDPRLVAGTLLASPGWGRLLLEDPRLEDLTVEILRQYGIPPEPGMVGRPVFDRDPSTSE